MFKHLITLASILFAALAAVASHPNTADPNWIIHSSTSDHHPRKVVDTRDAVYFFTFAHPYAATGMGDVQTTPSLAIFRLDKSNLGAGFTDVMHDHNVSGTNGRVFNVDPIRGTLAVAYMDGGVDIIPNGGKVTYIDNIKNRNYPGDDVVNALTFDRNTGALWIAAHGFARVPPGSSAPDLYGVWEKNVADIAPLGPNVVAIIDGQICVAPADGNLRLVSTFKPVSASLNGNPLRLLPIDDYNFGIVTSAGEISLATLKDGVWTVTSKVTNTAMLRDATRIVSDLLEPTLSETNKGYMVSTNGQDCYLLNRPETTGNAAVLETIPMPLAGVITFSSYDLETAWSYRMRNLVRSYTKSDDGKWKDADTYMPAAPLTSADCTFAYSPTQGFLASNDYGSMMVTNYTWTRQGLLLTSLRNGKWVNLSPTYNTPYHYNDPNYEKYSDFRYSYNANIQRYPLSDPCGMVVDPLYPDYLHIGSPFDGYTIFNAGDPREYPLKTIAKNCYFKDFESKQILDECASARTGCYAAGADADNNMWNVQVFQDPTNSNLWNKVKLWYLTPEGRAEAIETNNPDKLDWKCLTFDVGHAPGNIISALALKHPNNRGKIIATSKGWPAKGGRAVFLFDNKGTYDDTSDDTLTIFSMSMTPGGSTENFDYVNEFVENPVTGEVVLATHWDTYIINPNDPVTDFKMPATFPVAKSNVGGDGSLAISPFHAESVCFDEYGRLWVGGYTGGIIGIDAKRENIIAHWTQENSPLPYDRISGLGWNPETKTLFASGYGGGLVEINVDGMIADRGTGTGLQDPYLAPTEVTPDFAGNEAVRNVPDGLNLVVRNADGIIIATLPAPRSGVTFWDMLDNDGRRVAPGLYRVADPTMTTDFPTLSVTIAR